MNNLCDSHIHSNRMCITFETEEFHAELLFINIKENIFVSFCIIGVFSGHSFYEWIDFDDIVSYEFDVVWKSKIPFKIKNYTWLVGRIFF
jgi:ABC-type microcin C transport system permease subunit YejB